MPETKTAITAKPAANSAKAANSSCTKYNCAATTAARNHHIHLRLLSSVLVIGLARVPFGSTYTGRSALVPCCASRCPCGLSVSHLNHLTPCGSQNRWYIRHIFDLKRVY